MNYAIILAAGSGTRMEEHSLPKCFIATHGKMIFEYSLDTFKSLNEIKHIVLLVPSTFLNEIKNKYQNDDKVSVILGGSTRQESVFNALTYLKDKISINDNILIHDGARPLVSKKIILNNIEALKTCKACVTVIPSHDTVMRSDKNNNLIYKIPNRKEMYLEQTPASFNFKTIYDAHQKAISENAYDTSDDATLVFNSGIDLKIVMGERNNFKITNEIDLVLFNSVLDNKI